MIATCKDELVERRSKLQEELEQVTEAVGAAA
jgi:hypothetical protein